MKVEPLSRECRERQWKAGGLKWTDFVVSRVAGLSFARFLKGQMSWNGII